MDNIPKHRALTILGDPLDESPKVHARFVGVPDIKSGDLVHHNGKWRRVHAVFSPNLLKGTRQMVVGHLMTEFPLDRNLCRKVKHEINQPA